MEVNTCNLNAVRQWLILGVTCAALLATVLDSTILNVALPTMAADLHADTTDLQWIVDAYTLVFSAVVVTAGALGTRFGVRRALLGGLAVFAVASAAAGLSDSVSQLFAARAMMGLGAALVMPATFTVIVRTMDPSRRPMALGVWAATSGLGVVLGPTAGGVLLTDFSWPSVFWVNVPLVAATIVATAMLVPALPRNANRLDVRGMILAAGGLAILVDAIIEAPERGWLDRVTVGEFTGACLLLALFVTVSLRSVSPMIDLRLLANRSFAAACVAVMFTFLALFGSLFLLTQFLQLVMGFSVLAAGLGALPFGIAMAGTSASAPALVKRFGAKLVVPAGLGLMSVGLGTLSLAGTSTSYLFVALTTGVTGLGMGGVIAPCSEMIAHGAPAERSAMASSISSTVRELGGTLGVAIAGSVASTRYRADVLNGLADRPAALVETARQNLTAAHLAASGLGQAGAGVATVADRAFVAAMGQALLLTSSVAAIAAIAIAIWLPRRGTARNAAVAARPTVPPDRLIRHQEDRDRSTTAGAYLH